MINNIINWEATASPGTYSPLQPTSSPAELRAGTLPRDSTACVKELLARDGEFAGATAILRVLWVVKTYFQRM